MIFIEGVCGRGGEWCYGEAPNGNSYISVINLEQGCHHPFREQGIRIPEPTGVSNGKLESEFEMGLVLLLCCFLGMGLTFPEAFQWSAALFRGHQALGNLPCLLLLCENISLS
jgi:hypothetical protein